MSTSYTAVSWNKQKIRYHQVMWAFIALVLGCFIGLQLHIHPTITLETLIIRSTSLVGVVLLHIVLLIGPLCRLNDAFLPLLYNRRHLGVTLFFFAAIHGIFSLIQFHALGNVSLLESLFGANTKYTEISAFPFQILGFFALCIFTLMAITSHDFWLKNLSPSLWKSLHMGVYIAYGLVVMHVALGILQYETHPIYWTGLVGGFLTISGLHIAAGIASKSHPAPLSKEAGSDPFTAVCRIDEIPKEGGKTVFIGKENIALFRHGDQLSAVHNVCKHQMGPLAEGRVVDGCITCPWHGYQYQPHNGQSPPPFEEKLATYRTKIIGDTVWVDPAPMPEGTPVNPSNIN